VKTYSRIPLLGFALIEIVAVLAVISVLSGLGYVAVTGMNEAAQARKLEADVATVNSAIQIYLANGGNLDGQDAAGVIGKLKTVANADKDKMLGLKSSFLDPRTTLETQSGTEAASTQLRATWNGSSFVTSRSGGAGIKGFTIDDSVPVSAAFTEERSRTKDASATGWVWAHANATVTSASASSIATSPSVNGNPASSTSSSVATALQPPTFSPGTGSSALTAFPLSVSLSNPNPGGSSQIYYSSGATLQLYNTSFTAMPGATYRAVAFSLNPALYTTSGPATATYSATPFPLVLTSVSPSTVRYDEVGGTLTGVAAPAQKTVNYTVTAPGVDTTLFPPPNSVKYSTGSGTDPTTGTTYAGSVALNYANWGTSESLTLRGIALAGSSAYYTDSTVLETQIGITRIQLNAPTIAQASQIVYMPLGITINDAPTGNPAGRRIYYTTDGTAPSATNGNLYTGSFVLPPPAVNSSTTLKARTVAPEGMDAWFTASSEAQAIYTGLNFDFYNVDGVLIGGGNIANRAALNGSVVLVSVAGTQPDVVFNNNSMATGDIYAPGTPYVTINGDNAEGTARVVDLNGAVDPVHTYTIRIENNAVVGKIYRRITPVSLPVVTLPTGLVERGDAHSGTLLPGHYDEVELGNGAVITLGVEGATTPSQYVFDHFSSMNNAQIRVVGPVTLTLNPGVGSVVEIKNNMVFGNVANPSWLNIRMYTGGITLGNGGYLYGTISAPNGTVTFENGSTFQGGVASRYLVVSNTATGVVFSLPPPTE